MFCILLNVLACCALIVRIHSFYPSRYILSTVRLCKRLRVNSVKDPRQSAEKKKEDDTILYGTSPFIFLLQNKTTTTTTNSTIRRNATTSRRPYVTYDTVLWENGELPWDFPDEKNGTDNSTNTASKVPDPTDPLDNTNILRILGITSLSKNTTIRYV